MAHMTRQKTSHLEQTTERLARYNALGSRYLSVSVDRIPFMVDVVTQETVR
jgi:hypothetical protein